MLIVAVESATDAAGVAIADESGTIAQSTVRGRRHAETITPAIRSCCEAAGLSTRDLDTVAVDIGPGLFTGLRVGIATAKGLAYALRLPIVAVNSLDVLAAAASAVSETSTKKDRPNSVHGRANTDVPAREKRSTKVVPVIDARRGEVVSAEFSLYLKDNSAGRTTVQLIRDSDDLLETPAELAGRLTGHTADGPEQLVVGDGALRYAEMLAETLAEMPTKGARVRIGPRWLSSPPVSVLAEIGVVRAMRGDFDDPAVVLPRYVRQADTRINWSTRAPRSAAAPEEAGT